MVDGRRRLYYYLSYLAELFGFGGDGASLYRK